MPVISADPTRCRKICIAKDPHRRDTEVSPANAGLRMNKTEAACPIIRLRDHRAVTVRIYTDIRIADDVLNHGVGDVDENIGGDLLPDEEIVIARAA